MNTNNKIKTRKEIKSIVEKLKKQKKAIVTCNGCFDILHAGHIKFLEEAKSQGDVLIVALNSDRYLRENKGKDRPVNKENDRATVIAALQCVDYVTIFDEDTPIKLLELIQPDIHVNGEDYGENCIEAPTVKRHGGKVYIAKLVKGLSTTNIIDSLKNQ